MTMRSRPPLQLEQTPLVFVLAQVRFSALLGIEDCIPQLQQRFRVLGLPRFDRQQIRAVEIGQTLRETTTTRWVFRNKTASSALVLTDQFAVVETNEYSTFEDFTSTIHDLMDVLKEVTDVDVIERIGLRYVDLVQPSDGESLSDYLAPGLLGPEVSRMGTIERFLYRFESMAMTSDESRLRFVVNQADDGSFLPPDLTENNLSFNVSVPQGRVVTMLDLDHFSTQTDDFTADNISRTLWRLHDHTDLAFRAATTTYALNKWGNRNVDQG